MTRIVYKWAHGTRGAPAQAVGETVERLVDAHGGVCPPSALVEVARDEQHPCHRLFTWDDPKAAEAWRRHEARQAINSLRVIADPDSSGPGEAPAFSHVRLVRDERVMEGYSPTRTVVASPEQRDFAVREVLSQIHGLRRRYGALAELAPLWRAVEEVEAQQHDPAA